jgi:hypothetical protein
MIVTTLSVIALATALDMGSIPANPRWQTDYSLAVTRASEERKPIAVFIGHGADAIKRMTADGAIPADTTKLLAASYVCFCLDTSTESGKDLAGKFQMNEGLVISSPGGSLQAYRHTGTVPASTLAQELTRYATAGQPATTVNAGAVPTRAAAAGYVYVTGGCANGSCQTIVPASGQYALPGYSSCPNGRCPYSR